MLLGQSKQCLPTHVLEHECVGEHKRTQACSDSKFNSIMNHLPLGRDKMEITLIFEKKEKWKNNLTVERALFFASELEANH